MRRPATKDPCRLLLKGLNPTTGIDMVELYVENLMGLSESDYTLHPSPDRDLILIQLSQPLEQGLFLSLFFFQSLDHPLIISFLFCRFPKA